MAVELIVNARTRGAASVTALSRNVDTLTGSVVRTNTALQASTASTRLATVAFRALGVAAVALVASFGIAGIISATSRYQDLQTTLSSLLGSTMAGAQVFSAISEFATRSQFSVEDLTSTYIRLGAAGIQPTETLLRRFADVAARTTDQTRSLNAITNLYARTVSGGFGLEQLQMLADAGVPVFQILEEQIGVTRAQVTEFGRSAEGAARGIAALERGFAAFEGSSDALLGNLSVAISNVRIAVTNFQAAIGNANLGIFAAVINSTTRALEFLTNRIDTLVLLVQALTIGLLALVAVKVAAFLFAFARGLTLVRIQAVLLQAVLFAIPVAIVAVGAAVFLFFDEIVSVGGATFNVITASVTEFGARAGRIIGEVRLFFTEGFFNILNSSIDVLGRIGAAFSRTFSFISLQFKNIQIGIINVFNTVINAYISGLNFLIDGVNRIAPDSFQLPRLQGADLFRDTVDELEGEVETLQTRLNTVGVMSSSNLGVDAIAAASASVVNSNKEVGESSMATVMAIGMLGKAYDEAAVSVGKTVDGIASFIDGQTNDVETPDLSDFLKAQEEADRVTSEETKRIMEQGTALQQLQDRLFPAAAAARQYAENQMLLSMALADGQLSVDEYAEALRRLEEDYMSSNPRGFFDGFNAAAIEAMDTTSRFAQVGRDAFSGIADSINTLAMGGMVDFNMLALSIIADIIKIELQARTAEAFRSLFSFASGGGGGDGLSSIFDSIAQFQDGGIVGGTNGGATPVIAHAGEVILNQAQQQNVVDGQQTSPPVNLTYNLNISGNFDQRAEDQVKAIISRSSREIGSVNSQFMETRSGLRQRRAS